MDGPLIALTQQCNGDLRQLMYAFFSFLQRRTDFYLVPHPDDVAAGLPAKMGFYEGDAEKLLLAAFRQFPLRRIPRGGPPSNNSPSTQKNVGDGSADTADGAKKQSSKSSPLASTAVSDGDKQTITSEKEDDSVVESKTTVSGTAGDADTSVKPTPTTTGSSSGHDDDDDNNIDSSSSSYMMGVQYSDDKDGKYQIPVGNGGSTTRYKWTQTLEETTVLIGVPTTLRGKDFEVVISSTKLCVKSKKPLPGENTTLPQTFVDGELVGTIRPDESTWSVEGGVMILTLDKVTSTFWSTVIKGDEEIDTDLVDSRRHIGDYDDATQGQIRKIIFDQNQYHKGLPTSDEISGTKPKIPEMPPGVEYIDQKKLDEVHGKGEK
jgi:hypothetical protein